MGKCENISEICGKTEKHERYTTVFTTEELGELKIIRDINICILTVSLFFSLDIENRCLARVENKFGIKCDHYFTYELMDQLENYLLIQINICEPLNYMAVIGFVSVATFILGLLIICIIWGCIRAKDAREYARFEADQRNSYLMESPIYKDPITRYVVPKEVNRKRSNPFL